MTDSGKTFTQAELLSGRTRQVDSTGIEQVEFDETPAEPDIDDTDTVAFVNGEPILAGEVLERYSGQLEAMRQQMPPAEFQKLRLSLLKKDLPLQIETRLLVQAFMLTMSADQKKQLDTAMEKMYSDHLDRLMATTGTNSTIELDRELKKRHTSLAIIKSGFANEVMSREFLRSKMPKVPEPSRADLVRYYNEHLEDFAIPAKVRWEQIEISYHAHGSKLGARKVLAQAAEELLSGTEFAEVAKKYSDGPGADQGGFWDWTEEGTLKDKTIERALFNEPVGQISDVFAGETSFQVIRVVERQPAGYVPFEDAQDEIKDKLQNVHHKEFGEKIVADLRAGASVQTIFDGDSDASGKITDPLQPLVVGSRPQGGRSPRRRARPLPIR